MDIEAIEAALSVALPLRPPRFGPDDAARLKVGRLEDYLLESAYAHAELEEALHWLEALVGELKARVEEMTGWQVALPSGKRGERATQQDVLRAKRQLDPVTFDAGARARQLRESVRRQIARFEFEERVVSRAYTLISGG